MRGSNTEIRQQLRNQSLEDLLTTSINTVGGRIFPDDLAVIDMDALNQIVNTWRSTHVSAYGQVLPNSGGVQRIFDGESVIVGDNEVLDVVAISCANAGLGGLEIIISIGSVTLYAGAIPPTGLTSSEIGAIFPLTLSKGLSLDFAVTSGTSGDFSAEVAYQYRSR